MTAQELNGWMAYYQLEPWGCLVEDHRAELGLNLLFSINSKKGTKTPRFIDRDPQRTSQQTQSNEELEDNIRDFFLGRTVVKDGSEEVEPAKKPRKVRRDKGVKRKSRTK